MCCVVRSIDSVHMINSHVFHDILVEFILTIFIFVAAISSYKQVEGLHDINQLVGLLVPLLCDVPGVSKKKCSGTLWFGRFKDAFSMCFTLLCFDKRRFNNRLLKLSLIYIASPK